MKLYIAEDEEWIRRGIKKMIRWGELSMELAGEADNGVLAKEEILKKNGSRVKMKSMNVRLILGVSDPA